MQEEPNWQHGAETGAAGEPRPAGPELLLERFLPYRLSVLTNLVSRALARSYARRFALTIPQWRVLSVLARFPDISAGEVARKTAMDKVMVSRAVNGLSGAGRIERRRHKDDRRRSVLRLSARGHAVYRQIVPLARRYEDALAQALSAAERAQLDSMLTKLTRAAAVLEDQAGPVSQPQPAVPAAGRSGHSPRTARRSG